MKMSFKVEGGAELAAALNALPARVSKKVMREALEVAGEPIRRKMQAQAPREPGKPDIADNIIISTARSEESDGVGGSVSTVAIGPLKGFFYGLFLERGTIFAGAKPFMRPSFDSGVPAAIAEMARASWALLAGRGISRSVSSQTSVSDSAFTALGVGRGKPTKRRGGKR